MELIDIIRILVKSEIRRLDGPLQVDGRNYKLKAYTIENPERLIRIDIKEEK